MNCPTCNSDDIMQIRKAPVRHGDDSPREGEFTLCLNCGLVQRFAADLSLYTPTLDEMSTAAIQGQMLVRAGDLEKPAAKRTEEDERDRISLLSNG
jgi:hypothetical protein